MDFLLTPTGDISFELDEKQNNPFVVSFITSKAKTLTLSFFVDNTFEEDYPDSSLVVSFSTYKPVNNKTITMTTKSEEYEQQIRIRLLTVIGDMKSASDVGSYLEKFKHCFVGT